MAIDPTNHEQVDAYYAEHGYVDVTGAVTGEPIPFVEFIIQSYPVRTHRRKLRARWTLEPAQDLMALHGLWYPWYSWRRWRMDLCFYYRRFMRWTSVKWDWA